MSIKSTENSASFKIRIKFSHGLQFVRKKKKTYRKPVIYSVPLFIGLFHILKFIKRFSGIQIISSYSAECDISCIFDVSLISIVNA